MFESAISLLNYRNLQIGWIKKKCKFDVSSSVSLFSSPNVAQNLFQKRYFSKFVSLRKRIDLYMYILFILLSKKNTTSRKTIKKNSLVGFKKIQKLLCFFGIHSTCTIEIFLKPSVSKIL